MTDAASDVKRCGLSRQQSNSVGLRLRIRYKSLKRIIELPTGASFLCLDAAALAGQLMALMRVIRDHVTEAWSIALGERLIDASTAHNVFVVAVAVIVEGTAALFEGWALYGRYRWSRPNT